MNVLARRWPRSGLVGFIALPALLIACAIYFVVFASDLDRFPLGAGPFQQAINVHDHVLYALRVGPVRETVFPLELSNNLGIALIYSVLALLFPFLVTPDYALLALTFNSIVLVAAYLVWAGLCNDLDLGAEAKLLFFANLSLLYFAQLINKDMVTLLVFLLTVRWGLHKRWWWLVLAVPFVTLVRLQLGVFVLLFIALMWTPRPRLTVLCLYVLTSLTAGWLSVFVPIIGDETLGQGFSRFLIDFNRRHYVGYLLFNPVRVVQYALDVLMSFQFVMPSGGIDTARLLRVPQVVLLIALSGSLITLVTQFQRRVDSRSRAMIMVVVAYLLTWLMNPTVNARYVMLITPVLVLYALHVRHQRAAERTAERAAERAP